MINDVPGKAPVTMPVPEPIVATEGVELVQAPPAGEDDNVVAAPIHMMHPVAPQLMGEGTGLTVKLMIEKDEPDMV